MRVQLTETVLRDANQSLIATRLPYATYEPILSTMDKAGLLLRRVLGRRHLRHLPALSGRGSMGAPARSARSPAQHPAPDAAARPEPAGLQALSDSVVEKFVELSIKNGIDIIRIFDALNDFRNIKTALEATKKYATEKTVASGCISYTQSPVHTVEKYVEMCKELQRMGFDTICLKDMALHHEPL